MMLQAVRMFVLLMGQAAAQMATCSLTATGPPKSGTYKIEMKSARQVRPTLSLHSTHTAAFFLFCARPPTAF